MKTRLLLLSALLFSVLSFAQINVSQSFETEFPSNWTTTGASYPSGRVYDPSYSCLGIYSMGAQCNSSNVWVMIVTSSYISNGNQMDINFQYKPKYTFAGNAYIYYEINNSGTWTQIAASASYSTNCNLVSTSISSGVIPSGVSVKFRFQINYSNGASNAIVYFDNINISQSTLTSQNFSQNNLEVKLYPNPVNDVLNIETALELQSVEIYNIQGQKVLSSNQKEINVSDLASGMYMVRIQDTDNNIATKKIVIK